MVEAALNGRVGLQNMLNTCYLNSCIQCLSHTKQLTSYFLNKQYEKQINRENNFGLQGKFAQAYYTCIYNLWMKNNLTYRPQPLRQMISIRNEQFDNYQQQDASQLFTTVIDAIHEDLNRSKKRLYKNMASIYGRSDDEASKISWLHYLVNNQSIIVDIMTGLFKSVITCPTCKNISRKFDSFNVINLPIPQDNGIKNINFYVLHYQKPIRKLQIQFQQINYQNLKKQSVRLLKANQQNYKLYFLTNKRKIYQIDKRYLKIQQFHKLLQCEQLFLIQLSPEQKQITNKFQVTCFFGQKFQNKYVNLWLKRPFFINLQNQTGLSFTKTILRFLYIFCYKQRLRSTIFGIQGKQFHQYYQQMTRKTDCPFRLTIIKTVRLNNDNFMRDVSYSDLKKTITDELSIRQCINYILQNDNQPHIQENKKFQIIVEMINLKHFDFQRLNTIKSQNLEKNPKKYPKKQINLYECFDAFQCQENVSTQFYCQQCQENKKIIHKKMKIYRSPDNLVIVLSRFKFAENGNRTKNDKQVNFPMELDLEKYVIDRNPMNSYIETARRQINYIKPCYKFEPNLHIGQKFQLYAVVNHQGNLNSGHYTAYAKNQSKWYLFNDSKVTQAYQVSQKHAYMLFYRRKNK